MVTKTSPLLKTLLRPFRLYNEFRGRSGRSEFWAFSIFVFCLLVAIVMFLRLFGHFIGVSPAVGGILHRFVLIVSVVAIFSTVLPSLSVTVRRLHDSGKTGWFALLMFVPGIGWTILAVLLALRGETEANRYGPSPARNTLFG